MNDIREFQPEWISPPGDTIADLLEERGWTQSELAKRTSYSKKFINQLIRGKVPLSAEAAFKLEKVLGAPARFWMTREAQYREVLERKKAITAFANEKEWLKTIPYRFMVKNGWISDRGSAGEKVAEVLRYFRVASPDAWKALYSDMHGAYRRSSAQKGDPGAVAAWVRRGELEAAKIDCRPYDKERFKEVLKEIATLTTQDPGSYGRRIIELCASAGVAVVFVPKVPKAGLSGLTKWLTTDKALIQLSSYGKYEDRFWFTFFHEAGHILLHGKTIIFLESDSCDSQKEKAADNFAAKMLIPSEYYKRFKKMPRFSKEVILEFAGKLGIAPGIVVGRLQHDGLVQMSHLNGLKRKLKICSSSQNERSGGS